MIDFLMNFDTRLPELFHLYGIWVYLLVFVIIFAETAFVVLPFLPGDSMLFALGAFAGQGSLDFYVLTVSLTIAAVVGNTINYFIGSFLGQKILHNPKQKFFKMEHYEKAKKFYETHGVMALMISRFIPIVRSFAPFVAGVAQMGKRRFFAYNLAGGFLWIVILVGLGFWVGDMEFVKDNFKKVTFSIIFISFIPLVWEISKNTWAKKKTLPEGNPKV